MSQNQSYFWRTTRHNVFLKRSAKLQMLFALLAVLTFSTICLAEIEPRNNDYSELPISDVTRAVANDKQNGLLDAKDVLQNNDLEAAIATKNANSVKTGFLDAFTASISVILFTELGDKTFFIAAIMAMRHPRFIVFLGAITALALMTILSVVFGMAATIIPKIYTYYISTALFAIFGLKMIYDGYMMKDSDAQEELEEVQSDLRKREDELMRATRNKYEETDPKRKNSNTKDDTELGMGENGAGAVTTISNATVTRGATPLPTVKNPNEMQHRQRKQNSSSNSNKNNNKINYDTNIKEFTNSSPALSQRTTETQLDVTPVHKLGGINNNAFVTNDAAATIDHTVIVHSATMPSMSQTINENNNNNDNQKIGNGIDVIGTISPQASPDELHVGTNKRLERDVTSALVKDPESGVVRKNTKKSATYLTTRVMMQAFTMTFLAEWGDRSQLTTIILGASKNIYGVVCGGVLGHAICTGLAVIGGRIVATKISVRTVTILGGIVFLGFAVYALVMRPDDI